MHGYILIKLIMISTDETYVHLNVGSLTNYLLNE